MQRVRNVDYDEDDLYDDEYDDDQEGGGYTQDDRDNFTNLTPVVRAELDEAGIPSTAQEIEESLYHYYWDVGKTVAYLKNKHGPKQATQPRPKKEKATSKFDEAQQKSAEIADDPTICSIPGAKWFQGTPWTNLPPGTIGRIVPLPPLLPRPRLLGGSSKLAKLAEERRKRAAESQTANKTSSETISSLDRLSKPRDTNANEAPLRTVEPRKYPIRRKKSLTPPPKSPTPPPEEPKEELPDLRTPPSAFGTALSGSPEQYVGPSKMSFRDLFGAAYNPTSFNGPSPDDTVVKAQEKKKTKASQAANGLEKKTQAMKIDGAATAPVQPKVRSKGLDVPKLWAEEKAKRKACASFVVMGHVDHGKSTLMGRLLLDTGAVSQRDIDKYKKQATELGKASFALAWVMDTGSEERERGVTVDIAQHYFGTALVDFTILDAPGHRDFVPNMISGAFMADVGLLVVDANQLESGMKGQTKEHILLAYAVGLRKVIVAVNKMDSTTPAWDQNAFSEVSAAVTKLLIQTGFKSDNIVAIPCSGLSGENVAKEPSSNVEVAWVSQKHKTLLQQLELFAPHTVSSDVVEKPLRLQIADVFRGGITNPLSTSGRISGGNVQIGDTITIQPSGESATIKGIEVGGEERDWAVTTEIPTLHLVGIEPQHIRTGDMACSPVKPVANVQTVTALVQAIDSLLPQRVDVHLGRLHVAAAISHLVATMDAKGDMLRKKPRIVKAGQQALVRLSLDQATPMEVGDRVVIRADGSTIAAGLIEGTSR